MSAWPEAWDDDLAGMSVVTLDDLDDWTGDDPAADWYLNWQAQGGADLPPWDVGAGYVPAGDWCDPDRVPAVVEAAAMAACKDEGRTFGRVLAYGTAADEAGDVRALLALTTGGALIVLQTGGPHRQTWVRQFQQQARGLDAWGDVAADPRFAGSAW